jgi:asparagine synthase (glutamine-hydrolysing)
MAAAISRFDGASVQSASAPSGCVASAALHGDAAVFRHNHLVVAVWGRARFTDASLAALAQEAGTASALAHAYAVSGADIVSSLSGSFALAILDSARGEAILAVDRMGTCPLVYEATGSRLVFGSTADALAAFPGTDAALDPQAIYDYVHFHMVPAPRTIRVGQHRLLPGTLLSWRKGRITTRSYWTMRYIENEKQHFAALKATFLDLLRDGVRDAASDGTVGAFLSGGTDSSTVCGLLRDVTGEPARTYSIGFEADGYDEMAYARIAARHFGTRHHEYYVTPDDVVAAIPRIAEIHDQPFGNASAVPTYYCARLAREDGVDVLLGGDGGDELFGGNDRYAKQYLYSLYGDLPAVLRKAVIEPVAMLMPPFGIIGKAQRYMRHASEPMPARYDNYNLLERLGAANVFAPSFLDGVDVWSPRSQIERDYQQSDTAALVNRMLALDLKYTLADNDLPKVRRSCELARVDVRFPLLNDAIVGFSARLAPGLKLRRTRLRYFFKEALRGYLPDEVITKTKHGFGLPFGLWLDTHSRLREIAYDSLADLKGRDIVRREFIDELRDTHVKSHAGYYGTMVWVLMMLEQWLRQHADTGCRIEPRPIVVEA